MLKLSRMQTRSGTCVLDAKVARVLGPNKPSTRFASRKEEYACEKALAKFAPARPDLLISQQMESCTAWTRFSFAPLRCRNRAKTVRRIPVTESHSAIAVSHQPTR